MIVSAFLLLVSKVIHIIDSAASNHMTGSTLSITAVGNWGSSFTNVFVSPDLSANLIYVGQLVEENCSLHFDRSGCRVQDKVLGQEIAKGPKVGRLFPPSVVFRPSFNFCRLFCYC